MTEMFNGMFGKIAHGMCRLSMNGGIAVKTSNGYKSYNMKTKKPRQLQPLRIRYW